MPENRDDLHDLRRKAHEAGIEGNSKMTAEQLRSALRDVERGKDPAEAKEKAKRKGRKNG
ncbi:hypothetical protein AB0K60_25945 [Thermopolyspora sp. NPDC052614]|uniref:hypothetical protein n=1 Tax=Thermopolyspora sp. NPDC052614 TaxID=3155682 RepID=UPI0034361B60